MPAAWGVELTCTVGSRGSEHSPEAAGEALERSRQSNAAFTFASSRPQWAAHRGERGEAGSQLGAGTQSDGAPVLLGKGTHGQSTLHQAKGCRRGGSF